MKKQVEKYVTFVDKGNGVFDCWIWDKPYQTNVPCFRLLIPVPEVLWQADGDVIAEIPLTEEGGEDE